MSRPHRSVKSARQPLKINVKAKGRSPSQKHWLERQLNDPYVQQAHKCGYRARSAFKLIEIDDKYHFLKPGLTIVDLGAAPGSWSQVASLRVAAGVRHKSQKRPGRVIALDMHHMDPLPNVVIFQQDFLEEGACEILYQELGGQKADVVLSDMAAHATGHRQTDHLKIIGLAEAAYDFSCQILNPGGTFLAKVLRGGSEASLLRALKKDFLQVRHVKPPASRDDSAELFVLAMGFRAGSI